MISNCPRARQRRERLDDEALGFASLWAKK